MNLLVRDLVYTKTNNYPQTNATLQTYVLEWEY